MNDPAARARQLHARAVEAHAAGRQGEAAGLLRAAIALDPGPACFHADLAVMLKAAVPDEERLPHYRRAIELDPSNPAYLANYAAALNGLGRHAEAEEAATAAVGLAPERGESWHNLGRALAAQERWADALAAFEQALASGLRAAPTRLAAARAALSGNVFLRARDHFSAALADLPLTGEQRVECETGLAKAAAALGDGHTALAALQRALAIAPADAALLIELGNLHKRLRRTQAAREAYQRALQVLPGCLEARFNLAALAQDLCEYADAAAAYRGLLADDPQLVTGWHNLVACLAYDAATQPGAVAAELRGFESRVAAPLRRQYRHAGSRDPARPLRVAYVSADFRAHPIGYLALPLVAGHDRRQVHVTCYGSQLRHDEWTGRFRAAADQWVEVHAFSDDALADRVAADGIDILVDLAGHSEGNRLLAFARKPAPVQVTWMGYVTTTGMSAMDWRLTHSDADPAGAERDYVERLWRLPGGMWCFRPLPGMPEVAPAPMGRNGFVTFGVLNRFSKNSPQALAAWGELLRRVPDARLLVNAPPGEATAKLHSAFAAHGVAAERVQTFSHVDHARFWELHARVDIALDPFPFNGGMTTCETLWMGVPVVSCCGIEPDEPAASASFPARFASRMGRALLRSLGLDELAHGTAQACVEAAVGLAGDAGRLAALRCGMRDRMLGSPLMDAPRFVREVEAAYRAMWRDWCEAGHG